MNRFDIKVMKRVVEKLAGLQVTDDLANKLKPTHSPDSDFNEFKRGVEVEREHGTSARQNNITNDDPGMTADIAAAHLREIPDYYTRLDKMEDSAKSKKKE